MATENHADKADQEGHQLGNVLEKTQTWPVFVFSDVISAKKKPQLKYWASHPSHLGSDLSETWVSKGLEASKKEKHSLALATDVLHFSTATFYFLMPLLHLSHLRKIILVIADSFFCFQHPKGFAQGEAKCLRQSSTRNCVRSFWKVETCQVLGTHPTLFLKLWVHFSMYHTLVHTVYMCLWQSQGAGKLCQCAIFKRLWQFRLEFLLLMWQPWHNINAFTLHCWKLTLKLHGAKPQFLHCDMADVLKSGEGDGSNAGIL